MLGRSNLSGFRKVPSSRLVGISGGSGRETRGRHCAEQQGESSPSCATNILLHFVDRKKMRSACLQSTGRGGGRECTTLHPTSALQKKTGDYFLAPVDQSWPERGHSLAHESRRSSAARPGTHSKTSSCRLFSALLRCHGRCPSATTSLIPVGLTKTWI